MVEEGAREGGVLAHGREPETFRRPDFGIHSRRVARFIAGSPRPAPRPPPLGEAARTLLESRNMMSAESASFAQNSALCDYREPNTPFPRAIDPSASPVFGLGPG